MHESNEHAGFVGRLIGDGRPLLVFVGLVLFLVGMFALFLALTGQFLPHDVQYLGMKPDDLCALHGCRIVHFMMHDRAAFGGILAAVGLLYLWLAMFPIRDGEAWAWWLFLVSGVVGFASFLAYLGYGYLDSWHGLATLILLPCQAIGLFRSYRALREPRGICTLIHGSLWGRSFSRERIGHAFLIGAGVSMIGAGVAIALLGTTAVFVPHDLAFMGLAVNDMHSLNPRLIPLIAHDRAGFGGAVCCAGVLIVGCVWRGRPSRSLWQALALAAAIGFGPAILIHFVVGYDDLMHLAPAFCGAALFGAGLILTRPHMLDATVK